MSFANQEESKNIKESCQEDEDCDSVGTTESIMSWKYLQNPQGTRKREVKVEEKATNKVSKMEAIYLITFTTL